MFLLRALAVALLIAPVPALAGDTHGKQHAMHMVGDIVIEAAYSRATLPNQPVGGGFMTVTNKGAEDDVLVAVSTPVAGRGEIHEMAMFGDVMKMREMVDGLPVQAGETVTLEPGGYHLMFMDLAGPFVEGEMVEVTLTFEKAGEVVVPFTVQGMKKGHKHKHQHVTN